MFWTKRGTSSKMVPHLTKQNETILKKDIDMRNF